MLEIQKEYKLSIPFGHDPGDSGNKSISDTMIKYRTGGTPWFIFMDREGTVVYNEFHIPVEEGIELINDI